MEEILNENFLTELFRLCLNKKEIIEVCKKVLKYQYLPNSGYKEIWKQIDREYSFTNSIPSIGVLFQNVKSNQEAVKILEEIKNTDTPNENIVIKSLEEFVKNSMCIEFYNNFQEIYSQGNREKARELLYKTSDELSNFTLGSDYLFTSIFKDFKNRQYENKIEKELHSEEFGFVQPILGIDEIDNLYPIEDGSVVCALAQSGVGKTTQLVYTAVENARRGAGVLYVAGEGTIKELQNRFDACWTSVPRRTFKNADLSDEEILKLSKIAEQVTSMQGEIELHLFEQFNTASVLDIYNLVKNYKKIHGKVPDILMVDYLELFTVHDLKFTVGEEKQRRQAVARQLSNLIKSEKIKALFTSTQASNVTDEMLNSEEFVLTRSHISGDKNLLDSFSLFFSINQTLSEYNSNIMRLWIEKSRDSSKTFKQLFRIYTDYEHGSFYNRKKTLQEFATTLI